MCGIGGWIGECHGAELMAEDMLARLRHRGPDGRGRRLRRDFGLVHARLKVIDLTDSGAQPMANEDGDVWTVFNGEIYNHRELRRYLESKGHIFRGHSDTEVIPHLYEELGDDFIRKLRGMFALAVVDERRGRLVLARDRFGIKPLFYAESDDAVFFASEIKALHPCTGIDWTPSRQAIYDFAALHYIPAPETFFEGVRALEPGERVVVESGGNRHRLTRGRYHTWRIDVNDELTAEAAADAAEELISQAVERQLESDVPLGSLLSGGIDSSLVTAAAQRACDEPLSTFNVRFADDGYDETWAAEAVAAHSRTLHTTLDMTDVDSSFDHVAALLSHTGQPFADTSLFGVDAISGIMKEHVTVALSGDGGDEAFGGYTSYAKLAHFDRLRRIPSFLWGVGARAVTPLTGTPWVRPSLPRRIMDLRAGDDTSFMHVKHAWIRDDEHRALCRPADVLPVRRLFESTWSLDLPRSSTSRLEQLSAHTTEIDIRLRLPNDYLFKVDAASMRHALEVRVPMLDEELFAFGLTLPHRLKVENGVPKAILRNVARRRLPADVAAKRKQGFTIPIDTWVNRDARHRMRGFLLDRQTGLQGYFRPSVYEDWVHAFAEGKQVPHVTRAGLYQRVMMLFSVGLALSTIPRPAELPI